MATPISSQSGSPFTPQRDYPSDPTMSHLLALPPLLQPISPPLAALHLARVRLLLDIPTTSTTGAITEWWCHSCGGLREGLGGTCGSDRKGKSRGKRKIPSKKVIGEKRRGAVCTNCGERFKRMKSDKAVLRSFPSARIAARKARAVAAGQEGDPFVDTTRQTSGQTNDESMDIDTPPTSSAGVINTGSTSTSVVSGESIYGTKVEDTRRPIFNRVKDTEPNLPTYPPPASSSAGSPEKSKKRKKKSGLAKLLAENKERAAAQNLGGSWGLG